MGPPSTASGATWPMQKPWVPPEKRPSVMSAASPPRPAPFMAPVTASISRMPGPALGALVADDHDVAGLDLAGEDLLHGRRPRRRTPGRCPRSVSKSMPATFTTEPFGRQRAGEHGDAADGVERVGQRVDDRRRRASGGSMAARFSATVLPVTVRQSPWSSPASSSSFITTGTPPMRSRSVMWYLPWGLVSAMCGHPRRPPC